MTSNLKSSSKKTRIALACAVAALALVVVASDVAAAGKKASGGRMAQSSVSASNRGGNASGGDRDRGNGNRNRGNGNNNNSGNRDTRVNTGNINVGNDINVDIDGGRNGFGHDHYHPIRTAAVIGAVAVTTAAVVGSSYYALPPSGCTQVYRNGISYFYCGSVYYQQTWSGDTVVYVVVNP